MCVWTIMVAVLSPEMNEAGAGFRFVVPSAKAFEHDTSNGNMIVIEFQVAKRLHQRLCGRILPSIYHSGDFSKPAWATNVSNQCLFRICCWLTGFKQFLRARLSDQAQGAFIQELLMNYSGPPSPVLFRSLLLLEAKTNLPGNRPHPPQMSNLGLGIRISLFQSC